MVSSTTPPLANQVLSPHSYYYSPDLYSQSTPHHPLLYTNLMYDPMKNVNYQYLQTNLQEKFYQNNYRGVNNDLQNATNYMLPVVRTNADQNKVFRNSSTICEIHCYLFT